MLTMGGWGGSWLDTETPACHLSLDAGCRIVRRGHATMAFEHCSRLPPPPGSAANCTSLYSIPFRQNTMRTVLFRDFMLLILLRSLGAGGIHGTHLVDAIQFGFASVWIWLSEYSLSAVAILCVCACLFIFVRSLFNCKWSLWVVALGRFLFVMLLFLGSDCSGWLVSLRA